MLLLYSFVDVMELILNILSAMKLVLPFSFLVPVFSPLHGQRLSMLQRIALNERQRSLCYAMPVYYFD
jgi:hypothetical protein